MEVRPEESDPEDMERLAFLEEMEKSLEEEEERATGPLLDPNVKPRHEFLYLCLQGWNSDEKLFYSIWSVPVASLFHGNESSDKMSCLTFTSSEGLPYDMACVNIEKRVYLIGGEELKGERILGPKYSSMVMVLDLPHRASDQLPDSTPSPPPLPSMHREKGCLAVQIDGTLYVLAWSPSYVNEYGVGLFESYDPSEDIWHEHDPPPFFTCDSLRITSYAVVDRKLCVSNGCGSVAYDPKYKTWRACDLFYGFTRSDSNRYWRTDHRFGPPLEFCNEALVYDDDVLIGEVNSREGRFPVAYLLANGRVVKMQPLKELVTRKAFYEIKLADLGNGFFSMTYYTTNELDEKKDSTDVLRKGVEIVLFKLSRVRGDPAKFLHCMVYPTLTRTMQINEVSTVLFSIAQ